MTLDVTVGGSSADSYATLAEYGTYWTNRNVTLSGTDASKEAELRRAANWIDRNYQFVGMRQYQTQTMDWPRLTDAYVDGWPIDADTVPQDIKDAQMELAYLIQSGETPWESIDGGIKRKRVKAGPAESETEYAGTKGTSRIVAIEGLLSPYLDASASGQIKMTR